VPAAAEPFLSLRLAAPAETLAALQSLVADKEVELQQEQRWSELAACNTAAAQHAVVHQLRRLCEADRQLVMLSLRLERLRARPGCLDLACCPTLERGAERMMADSMVAAMYRTTVGLLHPMQRLQ
jgi:hypothetical protein